MNGLMKAENGLQMFENEKFCKIRAVMKGDEPWFVAKDVCDYLEIGNVSKALERLDEDEKGVVLNDTPGGAQNMAIISEPGLYSLVLGSRNPEAKEFKRWVTHNVLPSIRRDGEYMLMSPDEIEQDIDAFEKVYPGIKAYLMGVK